MIWIIDPLMMVPDYLHYTDPLVALGHKDGLFLLDYYKGSLDISWDTIDTPLLNKYLNHRDPSDAANINLKTRWICGTNLFPKFPDSLHVIFKLGTLIENFETHVIWK